MLLCEKGSVGCVTLSKLVMAEDIFFWRLRKFLDEKLVLAQSV
jgi:hypothetical protein